MSKAVKRLPIGIDDFKLVREEDYYFVDKSLLIKEILDINAQVLLLLRPRRFGKTINLSMLNYYFYKSPEDNSALFHGLAIDNAGEEYKKHQHAYPVISLTLKEVKKLNWQDALDMLKEVIAAVYRTHRYLLTKEVLIADEVTQYQQILNRTANPAILGNSLFQLSEYLHRYHQQKVVFLLDEYDTPIHSAYVNGYIQEMLDFMRNFLGSMLKGNQYLQKGVITGILRIAKESLFSGINNLRTFTAIDYTFSQYFGLLENEVKELLEVYQVNENIEAIREWYNGYRFGDHSNIYNPWSILNYVGDKGVVRKSYWVNTADTSLIDNTFAKSNSVVKTDLENLLQGKVIRQRIKETITTEGIDTDPEAMWNLLLFSGYLTITNDNSADYPTFNLRIPNQEVMGAFQEMVQAWFRQSINSNYLHQVTEYLLSGDIETFKQVFTRYIEQALSYFDVSGKEPERFYHALVLGMLVHLQGSYQVRSNRESGFGRYDVMLIPADKSKLGIVIEFKSTMEQVGETLEAAAETAMQQMIDKQYHQELQSQGVQQVLGVAMAFSGKQVLIKEKILS